MTIRDKADYENRQKYFLILNISSDLWSTSQDRSTDVYLVLVRTQTVSPVKTIQSGSSFLGEMTYALRHEVKQIELNQICQMLNCCVTG